MELKENSGRVKVITFSDPSEKKSLILDQSKLKSILVGVQDVPIAIVCVASRENPAITELLRVCFTTNATKVEKKVNSTSVWMDSALEDKDPGIWIDAEPLMTDIGGENVGILFLEARGRPVDTNLENEEQWSQLLGLSLLISSHLILPCSKFIQEALLSTLKNNCPNVDEILEGRMVFQNLLFLTYDWAITIKHEHGSKGGLEMLQSKLEIQDRQSDLAKKIRETIKKSFGNISCFLLPNSGQFFKDGKAVYDQAFVELMDRFILENLDLQMMESKKLCNTQEVLGSSIPYFIQKCIDCINNKSSIPLHESILDIPQSIANHQELESYPVDNENQLSIKAGEDFEVVDVHDVLQENALSIGEKSQESPVTNHHDKMDEDEIYSHESTPHQDSELTMASQNNLVTNHDDLQVRNVEVDEESLQARDFEQNSEEKPIKILNELVEKILANGCESEFPSSIEKADELAQKSKENAREWYQRDAAQLEIDNTDLLVEYQDKLDEKIDEFYNEIKEHLRKKMNRATLNEQKSVPTKSVEEIYLWARTEMPLSVEFRNDEEIKQKHEQVAAVARQKLIEANSTLSAGDCNELLEILNNKMDELKIEVISEFITIEKGYQTVYHASFAIYEEKMAAFLQETEFVREEVFDPRNNLFAEAENYFENFPHTKQSKPLYYEYHDRLVQKLESSAQEYRRKNEERKQLALDNIESRKALCMAQYDAKLKNAFRTTSNESDLSELHQRTKEEVERAFRQYNADRDPDLWEKDLDDLSQRIQFSYDSILDYCLLKWSQYSRIFETALNKATGFYNEQMGATVYETRFIDPTELHDLHLKATTIALNKCSEMFQNPPLSENQKENIGEALEIVYQKYENRNLMNLPQDPAIGIDLGTTYSCVAVFNKVKGVVEVITNRNSGQRTTPSYVAYKNGMATVGEAAKEQAPDNPENTVFDAKRMIGRRYDDKTLQHDMMLWPFKVVEDGEMPKIEIERQTYFPEQISAKVLQEMKRIAEVHLGCKVEKAVVTVPAYFSDGQRQATIDAGDIAGLKVLKIINEPTAAAIAYKIEHSDAAKRNVLIYDLGGGTFDVAILECVQTKIDVLVVEGDTHLGGVDFDARLSDYCCAEFKKQTGIDLLEGRNSINANSRAMASRILTRLKYACERCKKILSDKPSGEDLIRIDSVVNGIDLHVPVTKELFESINQDLFEKTIAIVHRALETAKMKPVDIDDIVLIGGSTRIPKVKELLSEHFGGKAPIERIHPDEAVAVGAAFQAAMTNGHITKESKFYHETTDVTPFSIGVEVHSKEMSIIIPKNTKVPHKFKQLYRTVEDNQTLVTIAVFQGEKRIAAENMPLGKFDLNGIPKAKKGKQIIEVEIEIDLQGVLHVTAKCSSTGHAKTGLSIMGQKWRMAKDVINKIKVRV